MCFFSGPDYQSPPASPKAPERADAEVQAAAAAERARARQARGRAATIFTSGAGDTSTAPTAAKVLLGQ